MFTKEQKTVGAWVCVYGESGTGKTFFCNDLASRFENPCAIFTNKEGMNYQRNFSSVRVKTFDDIEKAVEHLLKGNEFDCMIFDSFTEAFNMVCPEGQQKYYAWKDIKERWKKLIANLQNLDFPIFFTARLRQETKEVVDQGKKKIIVVGESANIEKNAGYYLDYQLRTRVADNKYYLQTMCEKSPQKRLPGTFLASGETLYKLITMGDL